MSNLADGINNYRLEMYALQQVWCFDEGFVTGQHVLSSCSTLMMLRLLGSPPIEGPNYIFSLIKMSRIIFLLYILLLSRFHQSFLSLIAIGAVYFLNWCHSWRLFDQQKAMSPELRFSSVREISRIWRKGKKNLNLIYLL